MSDQIRVLEELRSEFERVAATPPRRRALPAWRWRPLALFAVLILGGATGALAAAGVFQAGAPVKPHPGDLTQPGVGGGAVTPGTVAGISAVTTDPAGGPRWGMRTLTTTRGLTCIQVGRLVNGRLGVLGVDGAFHDDGRFHALPPQVISEPVDCLQPDAHGHAYVALESTTVPASAAQGQCAQPACPTADSRVLFLGLLGPDAQSITYTTGNGAHPAATTGPDGAFLIVQRYTSSLPVNGNVAGLLPEAVNGWPVLRIDYRGGLVCDIAAGMTNKGKPCTAVGYTPRTAVLPAASAVAAPLQFERRLDVPFGKHGARADDLVVTFTARVAVTNASEAYELTVQLPHSSTCHGDEAGTGTIADNAVGQRVRLDWASAPGPHDPLRCPGTYHASVYYVETPTGGSLAPTAAPITELSRALVGRFAFTVR